MTPDPRYELRAPLAADDTAGAIAEVRDRLGWGRVSVVMDRGGDLEVTNQQTGEAARVVDLHRLAGQPETY